jgi:hypothetical protein
MGQMGIQRSFLLLARHVLRIAREHDRLWSSLIKLRGIAALMSPAMTFLSKMSDTTDGSLGVTA